MVEGVEVEAPHARERLWRWTPVEQWFGLLLTPMAGILARVLPLLSTAKLPAPYAADKRLPCALVRVLVHRLLRVVLLAVLVPLRVRQLLEFPVPRALVAPPL